MAIRFRIMAIAGLLALLVMSYLAITSFHAQFYFVMSTRGVHDVEHHEQYLRKALAKNPSFGYANLSLARLMMQNGKYGAALAFQREGMLAFRPYKSYQQLATIHERLSNPAEATKEFRRALRMYPSDVVTLERLASLAFRDDDTNQLEKYADDLLRYDLNNLNALYLLGRQAERHGNVEAAFRQYQTISTELVRIQNKPERPLLFEPQEISSRLNILQPILSSK